MIKRVFAFLKEVKRKATEIYDPENYFQDFDNWEKYRTKLDVNCYYDDFDTIEKIDFYCVDLEWKLISYLGKIIKKCFYGEKNG